MSGEPHNRKLSITKSNESSGGAFWSRADNRLGVQNLSFSIEADNAYPAHVHAEYVVFICLQGALTLNHFGETVVAGTGEAVMVNGGVAHSIRFSSRLSQPCEAACVAFDHRLLTDLAPNFQLPEVNADACPAFHGKMINNTIHGCASEIRRELAGRKSGYKIALEHLAMRLLVEAFRSWPRPQIRQIAANFTQRLSQRDFFRAYDFMRRCRKELFRLQHLCGILGISEERFTRLFLASTNNTPANFYNRMLLERGLDLLGDSALSIKEISFELGFKTTSHFIASFRREFSTTPQEYRHSHSVGLINLEIAQFAPPLLENNRSRFVSA